MTIFYHIHRGTNKIKLKRNKTTFMSKKNSFWYNMEKEIGNSNYGGVVEYKINIPSKRFTTSLNPNDKTKIVMLFNDNIEEFMNMYPTMIIMKENFGGIDATRVSLVGNSYHYHDELILWNWKNVIIE